MGRTPIYTNDPKKGSLKEGKRTDTILTTRISQHPYLGRKNQKIEYFFDYMSSLKRASYHQPEAIDFNRLPGNNIRGTATKTPSTPDKSASNRKPA